MSLVFAHFTNRVKLFYGFKGGLKPLFYSSGFDIGRFSQWWVNLIFKISV